MGILSGIFETVDPDRFYRSVLQKQPDDLIVADFGKLIGLLFPADGKAVFEFAVPAAAEKLIKPFIP